MANVDAPYGLQPVISRGGNDAIVMRKYEVAAAYTTAIYIGTPLMLAADGTVVVWAATNKCVGVAANYRAGAATTANTTMLVYDDPDQVFVIQVDDNTIVDNGDVQGIAFGLTNPASGVVATQRSIAELTGASGAGAATTTLILWGIGLSRAVDDDPSTANNSVYVKIAPLAHENSGVTS